MSASLVGSEMCIRDSQSTPRGPRAVQNSMADRRRPSRRGGANQNRRRLCLLYTSDAADDM
eukprot:11516710-Alexandrium_andersonii.AAC.1